MSAILKDKSKGAGKGSGKDASKGKAEPKKAAEATRKPIPNIEVLEESSASSSMPAPRNEREKRLFELRLRMNQGRVANNKEVVEEQKRDTDPEYSKKKAEERHKRALEQEEKRDEKDLLSSNKKSNVVPKGKEYLNETIETHENKNAKKNKGHDTFGWDVFNQDSLYRAHDKRLAQMKFDEEAYKRQQKEMEQEQDGLTFAGFGFKASDQAKERLAESMDKMLEKKKEFSRRRAYNDDEDRTYVSDRNRVFNKKLDRFFGAYTEETRQNLERGTAL